MEYLLSNITSIVAMTTRLRLPLWLFILLIAGGGITAQPGGFAITEDAGLITISSSALEAGIRKQGYVTGIAAGTFLDKKTGFRDAGYGLDIVDWIMEPGSDEAYRSQLKGDLAYVFNNPWHGTTPKRSIEGPQICTQAKELAPRVIRGTDFAVVKMRYQYHLAAPGKNTGSLWEQTLVFPAGKRYFLSSDRITAVNASDAMFLRLDMPGHIKHKAGDTFSEVYLSYQGKIPAKEFSADFAPEARFNYRRDRNPAPQRFIRAYHLRDPKTGADGPWLAGMTLDPGVVSEAWCHQRGYVCLIEEFGGRPIKPGEAFSAAFIVGYFDSIAEMEQVYDQYAGHVDLAANESGWRLSKTTLVESNNPAATRGAFLGLLEKPRVPLNAISSVTGTTNGLETQRFQFDTDAAQRVPGVLLRSAAVSGRRPVVIALHGTGGNKEGELGLLRRAASAGFVGVAIDGRYHGERAPSGSKTGDYFSAIRRAWNTGQEHPFYYDTAWDIMRLIDYLETREDVDPARIGVIGFSKGGIETYFAAAADPRIAVAIPCIGVQSFAWALENNAWPARVETIQGAFDGAAADAGVAHPDAVFTRRFYDKVVPGIYDQFDGPRMLSAIAPRPLLVINGDSDDKTPVPGVKLCGEAAVRAYTDWGVPGRFQQIIQEKTGHAVTPQSLQLALDWFVKWLRP